MTDPPWSEMSQDLDSDALLLLQDVLDEVVGGRTQGHICPLCEGGTLEVQLDEGSVKLSCAACGKFFEGRFR